MGGTKRNKTVKPPADDECSLLEAMDECSETCADSNDEAEMPEQEGLEDSDAEDCGDGDEDKDPALDDDEDKDPALDDDEDVDDREPPRDSEEKGNLPDDQESSGAEEHCDEDQCEESIEHQSIHTSIRKGSKGEVKGKPQGTSAQKQKAPKKHDLHLSYAAATSLMSSCQLTASEFHDFVCARGFDVISGGMYRKFLVQSRAAKVRSLAALDVSLIFNVCQSSDHVLGAGGVGIQRAGVHQQDAEAGQDADGCDPLPAGG